jgi:hypothetical protein
MKSVLAYLTALLALLACSACGISHGESGTSVVRAPASANAQGIDVPQTLAAATAAAQANIDHFTAGQFADVWEHMAQDVRDGITQDDFVTFYETCKKPGPPISVTGLRLAPDDEAIVSMKINGIEQSRIMVYEDGAWNMQATDGFAAHLGKPLSQIIAAETAAGLCAR